MSTNTGHVHVEDGIAYYPIYCPECDWIDSTSRIADNLTVTVTCPNCDNIIHQ